MLIILLWDPIASSSSSFHISNTEPFFVEMPSKCGVIGGVNSDDAKASGSKLLCHAEISAPGSSEFRFGLIPENLQGIYRIKLEKTNHYIGQFLSLFCLLF